MLPRHDLFVYVSHHTFEEIQAHLAERSSSAVAIENKPGCFWDSGVVLGGIGPQLLQSLKALLKSSHELLFGIRGASATDGTRNARAPTSTRSVGFCAIWVCIRSSSSAKQMP